MGGLPGSFPGVLRACPLHFIPREPCLDLAPACLLPPAEELKAGQEHWREATVPHTREEALKAAGVVPSDTESLLRAQGKVGAALMFLFIYLFIFYFLFFIFIFKMAWPWLRAQGKVGRALMRDFSCRCRARWAQPWYCRFGCAHRARWVGASAACVTAAASLKQGGHPIFSFMQHCGRCSHRRGARLCAFPSTEGRMRFKLHTYAIPKCPLPCPLPLQAAGGEENLAGELHVAGVLLS